MRITLVTGAVTTLAGLLLFTFDARAFCIYGPGTIATSYPNVEEDVLVGSPSCPFSSINFSADYIMGTSPAMWNGSDREYGFTVFRNTQQSNGKLLVFLAGGGAKNSPYEAIAAHAATQGYKAIILNYWNDASSDPDNCNNTYTSSSAIDACFTELMQFQYDGTPIVAHAAAFGSVIPDGANNIQNRLNKILVYLNGSSTFSSQGWGAFLTSAGATKWSQSEVPLITFAGHSRGGKIAVKFASERKLHRLFVFSSPADTKSTSPPPYAVPSYVSIGQTGSARIYALYSEYENNTSMLDVMTGSSGLDLGSIGYIGGSSTGYGGKHRYHAANTDVGALCNGSNPTSGYHLSTAQNCAEGYHGTMWDWMFAQ